MKADAIGNLLSRILLQNKNRHKKSKKGLGKYNLMC